MKLRFLLVAVLLMVSGIIFADSVTDFVNAADTPLKAKLAKMQLNSQGNVSVSTVTYDSQLIDGNVFSNTLQIYFPSTTNLTEKVTDTALLIAAYGKPDQEWNQSVCYIAQYLLAPVVVIYLGDDFNSELIDLKSLVKGMDAVKYITHEYYDYVIENFVVSGNNHAANLTYLSASINDKRVKGIIPMGANMNYKKLLPYVEKCCDFVPENLKDIDVEKALDPYSYIQNITVPKLIFKGTNSAVVDSDSFYFNELKGDNYFYAKINTDENIWFTDKTIKFSNVQQYNEIITAIIAFFYKVTMEKELEKCTFSWTNDGDSYTLTANVPVDKVVSAFYYQADCPNSDFSNTRWNKKQLEKKNGVYSITVDKPNSDKRCVFVELMFTSPVNTNSYYSQFSVPYIIGQDN